MNSYEDAAVRSGGPPPPRQHRHNPQAPEGVCAVRVSRHYQQQLAIASFYLSVRSQEVCARPAIEATAAQFNMTPSEVEGVLSYMGIDLRTRTGL
jgi:hypothetical protein